MMVSGLAYPISMATFTQSILVLLLFCSILIPDLQAQDPRFSQYYAAPWHLNPAMAGVYNGRWRVVANYRDQWGSILGNVPFRTYAASFDTRSYVGRSDFAAFGLGIMHDEAGTARFSQNRVQAGGSYLKQLSGGPRRNDHYLAVGAQAGLGQNSLDWGSLWFSRQFNTSTNQPDLLANSGENNLNGSTKMFADFNAGVLWYTLFDNEGFFYAGAAAHHLNRPVVSLMGDSKQTLYTRWSAHAGGLLPLNDYFSLLPGVIATKQGPSFESNFGLNIRYHNHDQDELALRFGAWGRIGNRLNSGLISDAVAITGVLEYNRWLLGLSYDMTVSSLASANSGRGAFEVSLTYVHPAQRKSRIVCPSF